MSAALLECHSEPEIRAEVLLPEEFPVERKALAQLLGFAAARHPHGGAVVGAVATPDLHPSAEVLACLRQRNSATKLGNETRQRCGLPGLWGEALDIDRSPREFAPARGPPSLWGARQQRRLRERLKNWPGTRFLRRKERGWEPE
ncbi:MAG: hypothetical protein AAFV53_35455 [Myxococcota bacterium]